MSKTSIEKVDLDACLKEFDGSRYNLILAASHRAREIAQQRQQLAKNDQFIVYENKPVVEALCDIAGGEVGKEYLGKIK